MLESAPLLVALIVFASVTGIIFVMGRYMQSQAAMQRRLTISISTAASTGLSKSAASNFFASLAGKIDEKKFGIEGVLRSRLRQDLIRAGYFSDAAIRIYVIARIALVLLLPTIIFILWQVFLSYMDPYLKIGTVGVSAIIAIVGVDAFIKRRQRLLQREYRSIFPDLIDMLVVCTDAGLSLDGAFGRIQPEILRQSRALGTNLAILGSEARAGRAMADAIDGFAERLNINEARSFAMLLRQSMEMGTDIGDTLHVYGDEMRAKRLLRAEENANKLPVKMVLPLGLFIFPVILMVIMLPILINLMSIFRQVE